MNALEQLIDKLRPSCWDSSTSWKGTGPMIKVLTAMILGLTIAGAMGQTKTPDRGKPKTTTVIPTSPNTADWATRDSRGRTQAQGSCLYNAVMKQWECRSWK